MTLAVALCLAAAAVLASWIGVSRAAPSAVPSLTTSPLPLQVVQPVHVQNAGDGSGRLFIVERGGRILIFKGNALLPTPFLSITDRVRTSYEEEGLLSVAFPPNFAASQHFYIFYVDKSGNLQISRFNVTGNPDIAAAASEVGVLRIPHPTNQNHNGGQLQFGPEGFLYIGVGDGGAGGDPPNNAQNGNVLLGKLLRLDVESSFPAVPTYTIPASNPFTQTVGFRPEIWALGLRNPWRFSFDRTAHDLYIGDVGQNQREEIDFRPAMSGGGENYGWSCYEGTAVYSQTRCSQSILYTFPVTEYLHGPECSVTGGHVYRGTRYRSILGHYFYGDYCSGKIWSLEKTGDAWVNTFLTDAPFQISSFGEDEAGELYVAAFDQGKVYRLGVVEPALYLPLIAR